MEEIGDRLVNAVHLLGAARKVRIEHQTTFRKLKKRKADTSTIKLQLKAVKATIENLKKQRHLLRLQLLKAVNEADKAKGRVLPKFQKRNPKRRNSRKPAPSAPAI